MDEIIDALKESGYRVLSRKHIQSGEQIRLDDGCVVTLYTSGTILVQGRGNISDVKTLLGLTIPEDTWNSLWSLTSI